MPTTVRRRNRKRRRPATITIGARGAGDQHAVAGAAQVAGAEVLAGHRGGGDLERAARHEADRFDLDGDAVGGGGDVAEVEDHAEVRSGGRC